MLLPKQPDMATAAKAAFPEDEDHHPHESGGVAGFEVLQPWTLSVGRLTGRRYAFELDSLQGVIRHMFFLC